MGGVGHSAVQQDDLGVEDNSCLLKYPLAGDRRSNLPGGAQEIASYFQWFLKELSAGPEEVGHARSFCEARRNGCSGNTPGREAPESVDQRVGGYQIE